MRHVVLSGIKKLPNLTRVNLTPENGTSALSLEDVKQLMEAVPAVVFDFTFDFYGTKLSTADEEVHIKNTKIGNEGEQNVRNALDLLKNCKRFVLENCGVSNETMAKLRDDYRDRTKIVWRVNYGKGTIMTDAVVVRAVYDLVDDNCDNLKYLEKVRYMDLGHNEYLDACDFVSGMKSLEYVIISGAPIKSLEPFRNCKNLKFLELDWSPVKDLTPLKGCTALEDLNLGNTFADFAPIKEMTWLKNVYMILRGGGGLVGQAIPDARVITSADPEAATVGYGWRRLPNYYDMRDCLNVPYMN